MKITETKQKVYTLDAHILDNPKDPKSGHPVTLCAQLHGRANVYAQNSCRQLLMR